MKLTNTETKIIKAFRDREARVNRLQNVYFITDSSKKLVKIGITGRSVKERVGDMQPYNPYPLIILKTEKGSIHRERELHRKFQNYRSHNEWFFIKGDLKKYLKNVL